MLRLFKRFNTSLALGKVSNEYVTVVLNKEHTLVYSTVFLRDSCRSPESVDPHSQQKLFTTAEISKNLQINSPPKIITSANNEPALQIEWNQGGKLHTSEYPHSFLERYSDVTSRRRDKFFEATRKLWAKDQIDRDFAATNVEYSDYVNNQPDFFRVANVLNDVGIAFINNVPHPTLSEMNEENSPNWPISTIANKFGYIKKTFYGTLFDVKNKKDATNIAYTNSFLPLHMDLLYYESPPGLQFLHAIQNSTLGGENVFCDSFLAAQHVREKDPEAYFALTEVPITFQYDNDNEYYYYQRPLIVEKELIDPATNYPYIKEVNYSPPFQGPFELGITKNNKNSAHHLFKDFTRGLQLFEDFINDPQNQLQVKLKEGTCVVFDNRRVLHSRLEFSDENGGDRWLMGCYVDGDSFRSRVRIARRALA
ncbi:gamma-butyrobetaine dioxygenase [Suhomyces tanzawaensis NRRL Y-17324]|uniref:Gamma-butyrobetaine dioxygenase n=1 Tax=Suhomyces tanzawaensis NRRL Y-17324 TaxID=984487 RepID=A0A1E4SJ62_9ASCO|nr:gamma-butyrobetaine dioxygenase [Suhomyces tanzawaensis NRRL Y-17324]ODV79477.1 gamma-butyrobetaine dioxygenase [Suhomyces tanzawaensis NRRL Y-17324]